MELLKAENLRYGYDGKTILKDVSFSVNEGDFICIVGENGSGKTTLVKGILGILQSYEGKIQYSKELTKSHIGYLSQQALHRKDFPASVSEVVLSGTLGHSFFGFGYSKAQRNIADKVMEKVGITHLRKKNFSELSGGQQQRVLLARALCATKKLVLLDEPTSALDPLITAEFYTLLKKLNKEGVAVLMVSHDVSAAVKIASHIIHLDSDSVFFGTTHEYIHSDKGRKLLVSGCPCDACSHNPQREVRENA
ncbi:MAG: ABC transporter ATP-binding protein [Ruminococcus sp.]|nr:ABC transporter ATP-binding protein [Ruminococcus sp.]